MQDLTGYLALNIAIDWIRSFFWGLNNLAYNVYVYFLMYTVYEYRFP